MTTLLKSLPILLYLTFPGICRADQSAIPSGTTSQVALEQAEKLYQAGDWEKARQIYKEQWIAAGDPQKLPAAFFFNLGTLSAKAGAWGEAYVALLRAAFSFPADSDTQANLRQVQRQVPAAILEVQPALWFSWWPRSVRFLPWNIWVLLALSALAAFFFFRERAQRTVWFSCAGIAAVLFFVAGMAWAQERLPVYGAISSAKVKSGPGITFSDITTLEPGSLVNQEATRSGWLKIRFTKIDADNEIVGWVEPGTMLEVRSN